MRACKSSIPKVRVISRPGAARYSAHSRLFCNCPRSVRQYTRAASVSTRSPNFEHSSGAARSIASSQHARGVPNFARDGLLRLPTTSPIPYMHIRTFVRYTATTFTHRDILRWGFPLELEASPAAAQCCGPHTWLHRCGKSAQTLSDMRTLLQVPIPSTSAWWAAVLQGFILWTE